MSKAVHCIEMLQILSSGRIFKIEELANILETNPRNIIEYKKVLEDCGYLIDSIPGKFGGYRLTNNTISAIPPFSTEEKTALAEAYAINCTKNDIQHIEAYKIGMGKILSSISFKNELSHIDRIEQFPLAMPQEELSKRYLFIEQAIKNNEIVNLDYLSNDNIVYSRDIEPYHLFMNGDAWFVIGYCKLVKDYRIFKLCRISKYRVTGCYFKKDSFFNPRDYFSESGFRQLPNSDWHRIKIQLYGRSAVRAKDYCYGKDQIVTELKDGSTIIEVTMQFKSNIISLVLGFKDECKILEPEWLKEEVRNTAKRMK